MVVIVAHNIPTTLRGELTHWLFEVKAGVLVGNVSALVREKLWEKICAAQSLQDGALMIYTTNTEQALTCSSTENRAAQSKT